ncbi:MAG: hypothetical protein LBJ83_00270 [Oscillospiraceae bacterium]|jgi:hypothetical protein|nr:hypothetical protein [Oscillospiraceae bacterium]
MRSSSCGGDWSLPYQNFRSIFLNIDLKKNRLSSKQSRSDAAGDVEAEGASRVWLKTLCEGNQDLKKISEVGIFHSQRERIIQTDLFPFYEKVASEMMEFMTMDEPPDNFNAIIDSFKSTLLKVFNTSLGGVSFFGGRGLDEGPIFGVSPANEGYVMTYKGIAVRGDGGGANGQMPGVVTSEDVAVVTTKAEKFLINIGGKSIDFGVCGALLFDQTKISMTGGEMHQAADVDPLGEPVDLVFNQPIALLEALCAVWAGHVARVPGGGSYNDEERGKIRILASTCSNSVSQLIQKAIGYVDTIKLKLEEAKKGAEEKLADAIERLKNMNILGEEEVVFELDELGRQEHFLVMSLSMLMQAQKQAAAFRF